MLSIKRINNVKVDVLPVKQAKPNEILGYDMFPMLYCNIFLCAQKRSGKTNVIANILKVCSDKDTKVVVFASTHEIDDCWKFIKTDLEKRKITSMFYSTLEDPESKMSYLDILMNFMKEESIAEEIMKKEDNVNDTIQLIKFDDYKGSKIKIKKKQKQSPKYIIVFDDMSNVLKEKNIAFLLKTFRHYKSKVIISSQYFNDLAADARLQIDFYLIFKGLPIKKLEDIYQNCGSYITEEQFIKMYEKITMEKFNFLYIDRNSGKFRHNFNKEISYKDIADEN